MRGGINALDDPGVGTGVAVTVGVALGAAVGLAAVEPAAVGAGLEVFPQPARRMATSVAAASGRKRGRFVIRGC